MNARQIAFPLRKVPTRMERMFSLLLLVAVSCRTLVSCLTVTTQTFQSNHEMQVGLI